MTDQKELAEQMTALDLAEYNLDRSLTKVSISAQNDSIVEPKYYQDCLGRIGTLREVLDRLETWLKAKIQP